MQNASKNKLKYFSEKFARIVKRITFDSTNDNDMKTCIKSVRKCNGTLKLYFSEYCSIWTISWTPYLTKESSKRKIVSPKMAAHIIANVQDIHFYFNNGVDVRSIKTSEKEVINGAIRSIDNMLRTSIQTA